jgi:hypothetical protein
MVKGAAWNLHAPTRSNRIEMGSSSGLYRSAIVHAPIPCMADASLQRENYTPTGNEFAGTGGFVGIRDTNYDNH